MMNKKKQQFGIKYPFTNNNTENYFVDTNTTIKDKVRSIISHIIFTPKLQKIRDPEFGTNLIRYIFEQNDSETFDLIRNEIIESVMNKVNNVIIEDIQILNDENNEVFVKIIYKIKKGLFTEDDSFIIKL